MQNIKTEENEIDSGQLWRTIKNGWISILLIAFLITLSSALYSYFLPPIYSSDVKISFSDEEGSSTSSIIMPDAISAFSGISKKKLESLKLTLETRYFINSVIKEMDLEQRYFTEHFYRKNEIYEIEALDIFLEIHDNELKEHKNETLYNTFFVITPINNREFVLTIDALDYHKKCSFDTTINHKYFNIKVTKKHPLDMIDYYVKKLNSKLITDNILKNLTTNILSDNILELTYTDTVAKRAKEVVEKIAKKFREVTLVKKTSELKKRLSFLSSQIEVIEKQLEGEGKKLKTYQKESQTLFTEKRNNKIILEKLSEKKELLKNLKLQFKVLTEFQNSLKIGDINSLSLLNSGINIGSFKVLIKRFNEVDMELKEMQLQSQNIEKALTKRPQLEHIIERLQKEKSKLEELKFEFTSSHPEVIESNNKIINMKEYIRDYISADIQRLHESKTLILNKININVITTRKNIENRLKILKSDIQSENRLIKTIPEKSLTVQELKRKFVLSENTYTFLLQKKMDTEMALASIIENTEIIEMAKESINPIRPNKQLIVIVGVILGFILGIGYVLLNRSKFDKIHNEDDIKELTNLEIYGSLPKKKDKQFFEEAIRNIRTNLQLVISKDIKCINILISSTVPSEGKTTIAANLAESFSQTKKRVLIMDLDLRKPKLYKELNLSNKLGMTQYLSSDIQIEECIQEVNDNLDFFPAGAVPYNPSELLISEKFENTIKELSLKYEYIFFDTPPIGSVIDAKILLPYSDIVLLVVRANIAKKGFIERFNELKDKNSIKLAGIILNDVKQDKSINYGYGYGY